MSATSNRPRRRDFVCLAVMLTPPVALRSSAPSHRRRFLCPNPRLPPRMMTNRTAMHIRIAIGRWNPRYFFVTFGMSLAHTTSNGATFFLSLNGWTFPKPLDVLVARCMFYVPCIVRVGSLFLNCFATRPRAASCAQDTMSGDDAVVSNYQTVFVFTVLCCWCPLVLSPEEPIVRGLFPVS